MSCWTVRKLCGNEDQKFSEWVLEITIQNTSILKLPGGKRKTQSPDCWMIWRETTLGVAEVAVSYFEKLYATSHPDRIQEVTNAMESKVSVEMNQDLIKQFTKEEVDVALKQMHPTKAPDPDGMFAIFYQKILIKLTLLLFQKLTILLE